MMSELERLTAQKPAPQGDLRPWDSKIANAGAYIEDKAMMPNLGKVIQTAGLGSFEGIKPDQLVRAGTDVAMMAPQVGLTARTVGTAAKALPALYQGLKQGSQAALPAVIAAAPALGAAAVEGTSLTAALTGNHELADLSNMARAGQRGLQSLTARRDLDVGRQGVQNKELFGNERDQLAAAMRMARRGEQDMEMIRQKTGWSPVPNKEGAKTQWAMEIPDDQARIVTNAPDGLLSNQLRHPQLFDHYPEAAFIKRSANPDLDQARGWASADGQRMQYNPLHPEMMTERDQRGNVVHELQHWIQQKEGWPRGGNPKSPNVQDMANSRMEDMFASGHLKYDMPVTDLMKVQDKLAKDAYYNLAGEAQARSAAKRLDMTPAQRRAANPMTSSYDRNKDELVY
jgi:hypothetical protein